MKFSNLKHNRLIVTDYNFSFMMQIRKQPVNIYGKVCAIADIANFVLLVKNKTAMNKEITRTF